MEEEFHESEVFFLENNYPNEKEIDISQFQTSDRDPHPSRNNVKKVIKRRNNRKNKKSSPVNIPEGDVWVQCIDSDFFDDEDGEVVPPHLMVGRRIYAGKVAYSVFTGNGRTLKGRDLSEVRNSVLRMTGFLES